MERRREVFEEEGLHPTQVPDVPDGVDAEVLDHFICALLVWMAVLRDLHFIVTHVFWLQTLSTACTRYLVDAAVSEPTASLQSQEWSGHHKCGVTRAVTLLNPRTFNNLTRWKEIIQVKLLDFKYLFIYNLV